MAYTGEAVEVLSNYSRENLKGIGWEKEHYIANALNEKDSSATPDRYSKILSAIKAGLPLVLKTKKVIEHRVFIETQTVTIEYIQITGCNSSYIRCHTWGGFHWNEYLWNIVSLETPDYTLEPTDEYI